MENIINNQLLQTKIIALANIILPKINEYHQKHNMALFKETFYHNMPESNPYINLQLTLDMIDNIYEIKKYNLSLHDKTAEVLKEIKIIDQEIDYSCQKHQLILDNAIYTRIYQLFIQLKWYMVFDIAEKKVYIKVDNFSKIQSSYDECKTYQNKINKQYHKNKSINFDLVYFYDNQKINDYQLQDMLDTINSCQTYKFSGIFSGISICLNSNYKIGFDEKYNSEYCLKEILKFNKNLLPIDSLSIAIKYMESFWHKPAYTDDENQFLTSANEFINQYSINNVLLADDFVLLYYYFLNFYHDVGNPQSLKLLK